MLKAASHVLIKPITIILNHSLRTGIFPDKLKIAKIIPLHKKDDLTSISNYRPISILPSISKIFERVMFNQLYSCFIENDLLYSSQYGFRKGNSTEFAVLEIIDRIVLDLDKGETPINVYLDLSKAFDTLNHKILLEKLSHYGINDVALNMFHSYLSNRVQYVSYNDTNSHSLVLKTGGPQGSILGPLLFIIYINDLSNVSDKFKLINYADDSTLSSTLKVFLKNQDENINKELSKVSEWLKVNKLSLNIGKTKFMIFSIRNKKVTIPNLFIDGD